MNNLETALLYARSGFKVYPLANNTKIPLKGSHPYDEATTSTDIITNWFGDESKLNVGIDLASKNVLVVDFDNGHKDGVNGLETYKKLYEERHFKPLPDDTYIEKTPRNGWHWFLSYPENIQVKTVQSALVKDSGIDIIVRGVPIYPTSINGVKYSPVDGRSINDIKPCPSWLLNELKPKSYTNTPQLQRTGKKYTGTLIDYIVEGAGTGNRNVWMAQMAGKLLNADTSPQATYNMMLIANSNFLDDPLEEREINNIFKSILKREASKTNG